MRSEWGFLRTVGVMENKKRVVAITQARTGSTRLPGKVLMTIGDKTLLEIHLRRAARSAMVDEVMVATTTNENDSRIKKLAEQLGFTCYAGSEHDVLDRYYQAALQAKADVIIRITSDCPLVDPELIDKIVTAHLANGKDFTSNIVTRSFPDGMDVEVFDFTVLEQAWKTATQQTDREHVTYFIWQNSDLKGKDLFTAYNIVSDDGKDQSSIRLTLDYIEDFNLFKKIIEEMGTEKTWREYVHFLEANPEIKNLNLINR